MAEDDNDDDDAAADGIVGGKGERMVRVSGELQIMLCCAISLDVPVCHSCPVRAMYMLSNGRNRTL